MKFWAVSLVVIALSGCLGDRQTPPAAANDPFTSTPRAPAVALVSGKTAVGHRDFNQAKKVLPTVFRGMEEDFYCGCPYRGKTMDLEACGYEVRKNLERASRLEWEHVVPAWVLGHQRRCWQDGGRKQCTGSDPVFRMAEGDLVNLVPSVGEVNGDRSNFAYSSWTRNPVPMYGQCQTIVDFKGRRAQPREEVRGRVARIYFYMFDRYGLRMSVQEKKLMCAWAKTYPVDAWEQARDVRIRQFQGNGNPFVQSSQRQDAFCAS